MRKRGTVFPIFIVFFTLSVIIFLLSFSGKTSLFGPFEVIVISVQKLVLPVKSLVLTDSRFQSDLEKIQETTIQLVNQKKLEEENQALKDQFRTASIHSSTLLPAHIVGAPGFIPGVSLAQYIVIDKGSRDGVRVSQNVIYKDNLVGKIERVSDTLARISLISSKNFSTTAKIVRQDSHFTQGVIKGLGDGRIVLDNVLLSEKIENGDIVTTVGNEDLNENKQAPNLIIGKIYGLQKDPSALFQTASVRSLVDINTLSMVFVIIQ